MDTVYAGVTGVTVRTSFAAVQLDPLIVTDQLQIPTARNLFDDRCAAPSGTTEESCVGDEAFVVLVSASFPPA